MALKRAMFFLAAVVLLNACKQEQNCTVMGAVSEVDVVLPSRDWKLLEFCVNEECVPATDLGSDLGVVLVSDEPAEYSYRLRAGRPDGTELVREGTVMTTPYRANGAGCDPLTARARLSVDDNGDVYIKAP